MNTDLRCDTLTDFSDPVSNQRWITVNDNVMGGRSLGGFDIEGGRLIFEGAINTNGGGFSSIRWPLPDRALEGAEALRVRLKTDGRPYQINARTSVTAARRQIAYRGNLGPASPAEWTVVEVPFTDLVPTLFGRIIPQAPSFTPSDAQSIGLILADGQDGPFRMEISQIEVCRVGDNAI